MALVTLPQVTGEFGIVNDPTLSIGASGKGFLRLRGVAKDRVRDANGNWTDGTPCFIDIVCFGKEAENLFDSASKGDSIVVTGKLQQHNWVDNNKEEHTDYRIVADYIGVSMRWTSAKTPRTLGGSPPEKQKESAVTLEPEIEKENSLSAPF